MKAALTVLALATTALVPVLIDSAIKGTLLLVFAAVCVLVHRKSSSSTRHLVWVGALAALLMLPLLSMILPKWRILPVWTHGHRETFAEPTTGSLLFYDSVPTVPQSTVEPMTEIASAGAPTNDWAWAGVIWCAGFVLFSGRLFVGACRLRRIGRAGSPCGEAVAGTAEALAKELDLRTGVRILLGPSGSMPMTWGLLRPRILLPAEASNWEPTRLRAVLLHELAHVKRRDTATQLVVRLACALHWFNPLVWVASRRIELERERACDDLVLGHGVRASDYAENLLHIVGGSAPGSFSHAGLPMARISTLEERLGAVLDERLNRRRVTRGMIGLLVGLGLAIVLPMSMLDAADEEKPETAALTDTEEATAKAESATAPPVVSPSMLERRDELKAQLADLLQRYNEKYPTVIEMRAQINRLQAEIDKGQAEGNPEDAVRTPVDALITERDDWTKRRDDLLQIFTEKHPRVIEANARITKLETAIENAAYENEARRLGLPPEVLRKPIEEGNFAGIGIALTLADSGYPSIGTIIPEGAAAKDGTLKVGDEIRAVDLGGGQGWIDLQHMKMRTVVKLIRGEPETKIRLRIGKADGTVFELEIERQAMALSIPLGDGLKIEETPIVAQTVPLRFADASTVADYLKAFTVKGVTVVVDERTNAIILKGPFGALIPLMEVMSNLDNSRGLPGPEVTIRFRAPKDGGEVLPEIDGNRHTQELLQAHILLLNRLPLGVIILADKETPFTPIRETIQTLKDCGIENVTFREAEPGER